MTKFPQYLVTFWAILKNIPVSVENLVATIWANLEKKWAFFTPTSGHTGLLRDTLIIFDYFIAVGSFASWV